MRENWRGAELAFPLGALLVSVSLIALVPLAVLDDRADLDLLEPGLGRWFAYVLGVALLGLLDDMLGRGHAGDTARGWRGHARAVAVRAAVDRRDQGGRRASGWPRSPSPARPRGLRLPRRPGPAAAGDEPLQPARPASRAGREGARDPARRRSASAPGRSTRCSCSASSSARSLVGAALTLRERAMLGDAGANLAGARRRGRAARHARRRTPAWSRSRVVVALTAYGEFRSISAAIERLPVLRDLDRARPPALKIRASGSPPAPKPRIFRRRSDFRFRPRRS